MHLVQCFYKQFDPKEGISILHWLDWFKQYFIGYNIRHIYKTNKKKQTMKAHVRDRDRDRDSDRADSYIIFLYKL